MNGIVTNVYNPKDYSGLFFNRAALLIVGSSRSEGTNSRGESVKANSFAAVAELFGGISNSVQWYESESVEWIEGAIDYSTYEGPAWYVPNTRRDYMM